MKTYGEVEYSRTNLSLGTRWKWVVSYTSRPFYHQEHSLSYRKRLGEHQSWSGRYKENKNFLLLLRIEPRFLGLSARSVVAVPTRPSLLLVFSMYEFTFRIRTGCSELGFFGLSRNMQVQCLETRVRHDYLASSHLQFGKGYIIFHLFPCYVTSKLIQRL
jgi:hypothetical protein